MFGHKPFLLLADTLTKAGVAVLRFDDRGVGSTTAPSDGSTLKTELEDVRTALAWLRTHPSIDGTRVGILGHGTGAMLAAAVAAKDPKVAFIVSLGGLAIPGAEAVPAMGRAMLLAQGNRARLADDLANAQRVTIKALLAGKNRAQIVAAAARALGANSKRLDASTRASLRQSASSAVDYLSLPVMRSLVATNPAKYWQKVRAPTLALYGSKDTLNPPRPALTSPPSSA